MARKFKAVDVVNAVNNEIKKAYNYNLPAVTVKNFADMADELRTAPQAIVNAWHDTLINLIGMQIMKNKRTYESYFRRLHQAPIRTFDVQMLMIDLIDAKAYSPDADADDFFADEKADIQAQYSNRVIKLKWPVSINEESLYGAFLNAETFDNYLDNINRVLYSSMEMGDVSLTKEVINQNVKEGNIRIVPIAKPTDRDTALAFTAEMKKIAKDAATEMSQKYNLSGLYTWTPEEDGIIISNTDTEAITETYSLAWAFNKELIDLEKDGRYISMASDAIADGKVYAIYADRYAFEIRDIVGFPKTTSQYFGNTLTLKRWLHYWGLYTMSYFNTCVAFIDPADVEITGATITTRSGSLNANRGENVKMIVSAIETGEGKFGDKFGEWSISGNTSANTTIDKVSGKLTISDDEASEDGISVVWRSHLNNEITANATITINQ